MSERQNDPTDILNSAKLYTSPIGLIGRKVEFAVEGRVCAAMIIGCEFSEIELRLTVGLQSFKHHPVHGLLYTVQERSWTLCIDHGTEKKIDRIKFSDA